jgi:hypothetical protein
MVALYFVAIAKEDGTLTHYGDYCQHHSREIEKNAEAQPHVTV